MHLESKSGLGTRIGDGGADGAVFHQQSSEQWSAALWLLTYGSSYGFRFMSKDVISQAGIDPRNFHSSLLAQHGDDPFSFGIVRQRLCQRQRRLAILVDGIHVDLVRLKQQLHGMDSALEYCFV